MVKCTIEVSEISKRTEGFLRLDIKLYLKTLLQCSFCFNKMLFDTCWRLKSLGNKPPGSLLLNKQTRDRVHSCYLKHTFLEESSMKRSRLYFEVNLHCPTDTLNMVLPSTEHPDFCVTPKRPEQKILTRSHCIGTVHIQPSIIHANRTQSQWDNRITYFPGQL